MHSFAPISIRLFPSRRLRVMLFVAHGAAGLSVALADVPIWSALLLYLAIAASLLRQWTMTPPHTLLLRDAGRFEEVGADGTASEAELDPATVVTATLVVLVYRQGGRMRALTLPSDCCSPEEARQLRFWLRWRGGAFQPA